MSGKKLIKKFKEDFLLSDKYEYEIRQDDCGATLEVMLPKEHAKKVRKKVPDWYKGHRTIIKFRTIKKKEKEDEEEL
jgi:hypothetical protein